MCIVKLISVKFTFSGVVLIHMMLSMGGMH